MGEGYDRVARLIAEEWDSGCYHRKLGVDIWHQKSQGEGSV